MAYHWTDDAAQPVFKTRIPAVGDRGRDDRTWKKDFQDALGTQTQQIDKLLEGLKEEKEARQQEDRAIRSRLESLTGTFASLRTIWVLVALVAAAILGGLAEYFVPKILGH